MAIERKLRLLGVIEGLSLLMLLIIAMPLKYFWGLPMAVRIAGSLHGILFLWYCLVLFQTYLEKEMRVRSALLLLGSAVLPFGFLFMDRLIEQRLKQEEAS